MTKLVLKLSLSALAMCAAKPALAFQETYVASNGADTGQCIRSAPCRSLQYAHNQTDAGGEVNVIDIGEYGPVRITKSITIKSRPGDAKLSGLSTPTTGFDTITINAAATDVVVLQGLDLDGTSIGGQATASKWGIYQESAASVYVIDCTIKNYGHGVENGSFNTDGRMFIQRSNILRTQFGVTVGGSGRVVSVLDSLIDNSSSAGVSAISNGVIGMARSVINAGPVAIRISGVGQIVSIGPSNIISGTGGFTATVPFN